ncbi:MAG: cysteine desulfurase [Clostridiales bacterium]|nr:cysteine desulfurase [Clostridiales bacterium]
MIYLDHAATTPLDGAVLEKMTPYLTEIYGNPSSQHAFGQRAANAVQSARDKIAEIMGVAPAALYFTSGGTEAGNTALKGVCAANRERGRHIVLSAIEHPALLSSAADMQKYGFEVTLVKPDINGVVSAGSVAAAIRPDTVFAGVMAANNETGVIQPIKEIYAACRERGVFFYCDCVQTAGVLDFSGFPADGIGFAAHKFYGPKGFGGLYVRGNCKFERLLSGGSQEKGLRGGTTFVAGAVGCAYALERACACAEENNKKVAALRDGFVERVLAEIDGTHLNGDGVKRLPSNANISFDGCDGEQIAFALDLRGIAVSTGSACSSGAVTASHVLTAMGLNEGWVKSAVRFTFGKYNTPAEVDFTVSALKEVVDKIRKTK